MNYGHLTKYDKETGLGWVEIATGASIPFIVNPGTEMPAEGTFVSFTTGPRALNITEERQPQAARE